MSVTASAHEKGVQEAKAAIAEGKLKIKEYPPLPSPAGHGEFIKLLKEKCGVDYEVVSAPGFSEDLQAEVKAWNDVMRPEIQRRFGPTIFQDLEQEALQRWQKKSK
jgi:hypothetical protein